MKRYLLMALLLSLVTTTEAQLLKNAANKVKQKVDQKTNQAIDKTIDDAVDG